MFGCAWGVAGSATFWPQLMGRDIKVESYKVDTRVRHLGQQKKWIGHLGQKNYIFSLT